ncbi:hypothetical protein BN2475_340113 [Paraburkholderia ribeironis]|uniref:Uncharacterized protein n=1 Tax=Paraburkholderia ribeironis TaxID=1247936 RepID=A0A1N7S477_9BURK|nr:hypothetical protein BN2475_340113 [Paraburkholderia ribeironis]
MPGAGFDFNVACHVRFLSKEMEGQRLAVLPERSCRDGQKSSGTENEAGPARQREPSI